MSALDSPNQMHSPVPQRPSHVTDSYEDTQLDDDMIPVEDDVGPEEANEDAVGHVPSEADVAQEQTKSKIRKEKAPIVLNREPGRSLLPYSRVQKILKADKELPLMQREATHAISLATEKFIERISLAIHRAAQRDGRATMQYRDVASLVRRADEFLFLDEIIPLQAPEPPAQRKPKALQEEEKEAE
ncbi:hypothetical protein AcW1_007686 [Taiwanofungus camphoratus]|nr:hypothetical protein AcV7_009889 [Antrodia cinnamomea]KAI0953481.1 hypothetical protein AcW1_007686 [Antrodia cinnamomea]